MKRGIVLALLVGCGGGAQPAAESADPHGPHGATPMASSSTNAAVPTSTAASSDARPPASVDEVARRLREAMNARDPVLVQALYNARMREVFPLEKEKELIDGTLSEGRSIGTMTRTDEGQTHAVYDLYTREGKKAWRLTLDVDEEMKIAGYTIHPAKEPPEVAKSTFVASLPFRGEWVVAFGGDTIEMNGSHLGVRSQRRAADLGKVDAEGRRHSGDGKKNADYFTYGAEVLAIADGVVVVVIDGVPDNTEPGEMNRDQVGGNEIVLQHEGGLLSRYAHLQRERHRVKRGAKVRRGDVLGIAGNSGNSSKPHLHFQLEDDKGWGVETVFTNVYVRREGVATAQTLASSYTFRKGDRITNAPAIPKKP